MIHRLTQKKNVNTLLQYQRHMLSVEFLRGIEFKVCLDILMQFVLGHEA